MPLDAMNPESFGLEDVKTLELVSEATVKKLGGSLAWAAAGGVLFGPAGAIVGSTVGGNKNEVTFIAEFHDGRSFVGVTDAGNWAVMRRAALKSPPATSHAPVRRSGEQSPGRFAKTYSAAVPAEMVALILVVASLCLFVSAVGFIACWIFGGPASIFGWASVMSFAVVGISAQAAGVRNKASE